MSTRRASSKKQQAGWKILLQPGWILTFILVIGFSYLAISILSPWQLGKDDAIVERNERVDKAFKEDPTSFNQIYDDTGTIKEGKEWMRISAHGHFLPDKEVLLRLRPIESGPVYQALTPFVIDNGPTLLVNRGWEPTTAGAVPEIPPAPEGEITIIANARINEPKPNSAPLKQDGFEQVYGINTQQVSDIIGIPLATDYAQLTAESTGVLNPIPIPKQDRGNHLSYGFQWIAFGIMAPLGLGYMVFSEFRERRRAKEEEAELAAAENNGTSESQAPAALAPEEPAQPIATAPSEDKENSSDEDTMDEQTRTMRNRYGSSHPNRFARKHQDKF